MPVIPALLPHERRVRQMMCLFGQDVPPYPAMPDDKSRICCARLLLEEVLEYVEAAGLAVKLGDQKITFEDLAITVEGAGDLVEMTDALADISVVNTVAFATQGTRMAPILECVDANNISKYSTGHLDATGKFIKSPNHPKPDMAAMLKLQHPNDGDDHVY